VTLPDHVHRDQPDLIYVIEGKATMFSTGSAVSGGAGMVVQVPPNTNMPFETSNRTCLSTMSLLPAMNTLKGGK